MNISLNWLQQYIDLSKIGKEEISEILTTIGLEVEGVEEIELIKGGLKGVIVGEVIACEKHPDADKLKVTKIDLGDNKPIQVVCGAPNVDKGQKVLLATIGTTLYNDGEPWKIKKGKIRGQESHGMICAEDELGLGSSHEGILVLPSDTKPGTLASDIYDTGSDVIFDIGLTPNRSDATSHMGVAKDLSAYLKVHKEGMGGIKEIDVSGFSVNQTNMPIKVDVHDTVACPRYTGITLTNIEVKESPEWIQKHLKAIGVNPINNVVDITNYVLHELGQPLHAFDFDQITNQHVIVDTLSSGTEFLTLDEQKRYLHEEDLMICDGEKNGMCIAGVFGGIKSGVSDSTKSIFLESAHFNAGHIRKTSTRHLLRTDAAKVFEKGSDPNITLTALKRAVILLEEYANATIASEVVDIYPKEITPREIYMTYDKINKVIGNKISADEVHNILRALDMEIKPTGEDGFKVMVPTNKADVHRDVDIIEEILRIYGFNKITIPEKVNSTINYSTHPDKKSIKNIVANHLSAKGYNEIMGLSLIESKYYREVLELNEQELVYINNTSNLHLDIMRPEMLLSGLLSVQHNHNRQQQSLKLYEFGKAYRKKSDSFEETEYLTVFTTGKRTLENWLQTEQNEVNYFDIKNAVHQILDRLGITSFQVSETEDKRLGYGLKYHRGQQTIAMFGEVSSAISRKMGIKSKVYYAEINIEKMVAATKNVKTNIEQISKYPSVRRDLALVVDIKVKFEDIQQIGYKINKTQLKAINLFDVYTNEEHLGKGKKSYAVSYHFEDMEKTLKDKDIDKTMKKMIEIYSSKLGAKIRS